MSTVRVQGPTGTHDVALDATATMQDLKSGIEAVLGISSAAQQIKSGFPPKLVSAEDDELVSSVLGAGSARILVASNGAVAAAAGTGRRKPQAVRRVNPGSNPADVAATPSTSRARQPLASADAAHGSDGAASGSVSGSAAPKPAAKRKRGGKSGSAPADEDEGDPLIHTLNAAKEEAAKNNAGKAKGSRPRTVEQLVQVSYSRVHGGRCKALPLTVLLRAVQLHSPEQHHSAGVTQLLLKVLLLGSSFTRSTRGVYPVWP